MKSFLLAAKIATVFLLVMGTFVFVTLHLFTRTVTFNFPEGVNPTEAHTSFVIAVLWVSLVARLPARMERHGFRRMVLLTALSIYVTTPLRRMSRSMDRVAAGDLEHRVTVRGRDEGAAMGRSFNAMAERVRGMIVGQKELMAGVLVAKHEEARAVAMIGARRAVLGDCPAKLRHRQDDDVILI